MDALPSQGVTLHYSDGGSPTNFALVGGIIDFPSAFGGSSKVIDNSDLDSSAIEKLLGIVDEGQVTLTLKFNPDNAVHQALRDARYNRTKLEFKITLTDTTPSTITFFAYVAALPLSIPFNDKITANVTLEVTGRAVWA